VRARLLPRRFRRARFRTCFDLSGIQVRGSQRWIGNLPARDQEQTLKTETRRCQLAETDPETGWQWAFTEVVSIGSSLLHLGHEQADTFLVADNLAAAGTASGQLSTTAIAVDYLMTRSTAFIPPQSTSKNFSVSGHRPFGCSPPGGRTPSRA
jgi:hypothetical protein